MDRPRQDWGLMRVLTYRCNFLRQFAFEILANLGAASERCTSMGVRMGGIRL